MSVITQLAHNLDKSESEVTSFLVNAPRRYKVYTIPKRKHGHRVIAHPSKELKKYQRLLIKTLSPHLPIHNSAMAYKKNIGIKENALAHCEQRYLLKMDLENFFNSINPQLFFNTWEKVIGNQLSRMDRTSLEKLLFWCPGKKKSKKLVLSVGAPSSPLISNFCMYSFDELINQLCVEQGITYTRYADDLTFSSNQREVLFAIPSTIQKCLYKCFGRRLTINHSKTVFSSKAHNRHVTGITITNEGNLSLGRNRKRYIKHLIHHFQLDKLNLKDINHLKGWLLFAKHIEPTFLASLKKKYSDELIKSIFEADNE